MSAEPQEVVPKTPGEYLGLAMLCCNGDCTGMAMIAMALHAGIVPVSADPSVRYVTE